MNSTLVRQSRFVVLALALLVTVVLIAPASFAATSPLVINEVLVGNASTNLDSDYTNFSPWIELLNTSGSSINLANYSLRSLPDGAAAPQTYKLPGGTTIPANGLLLVWADEHNTEVHAGFDLDMDGGEISLLAPDATLLDSVTLGSQSPDVSYGRTPDGGATWAYFDRPTPETANTSPEFATVDFAASPVFSVPGGLVHGAQTVGLSTTEPGGTIRYTLDGSRPTSASPIYTTALTFASNAVIRARTYAEGKMVIPVITYSYLVNIPVNLPVISIVIDPPHLWDPVTGIYTQGVNGIWDCGKTANWHQPWERPASFEYYEMNGDEKLRQDVGIEIFGNCTRNYDRKSLEIKAKKRYGDNDLDYAFFSDKPMKAYKRLVLRNAGQDNAQAVLRDAMIQALTRGRMDLDSQAYRPAVVYINGAYWGFYDMREKMDEDFVENNYGLKEGTFDVLEEIDIIKSGNTAAWDAFYAYVSTHNLADPSVYAHVKTQMDVNEYINYQIAEIYAANTDWPHKNIRYWRAYTPGSIWRWLLYDLDAGFGRTMARGYNHNTLKLATEQTGKRAYWGFFFRKMLENPEFKAEFAQRFAAHLNTTYEPARVIGIINTMQAGISPEMPAHIARWHKPSSLKGWNTEVERLRTFALRRPTYVRQFLNSYLKSPGLTNLTINITGAGKVFASGVELPTVGYVGQHFRNLPLTLRAMPMAGARFVRWQETGDASPTITLSLTGSTTRTAVFEDVPVPKIVINELHYNPSDTLQGPDDLYEFLELINTGTEPVDLSNFQVTGIAYTFPAGASIAAGEIIVLAKTSATYAGNGYQVFGWNAAENLSNGGERVAVLDAFSNVVDDVTYDDVAPWPTAPDDGGPSLALLDPGLDNSLASSWAASAANNGTPGVANEAMPLRP